MWRYMMHKYLVCGDHVSVILTYEHQNGTGLVRPTQTRVSADFNWEAPYKQEQEIVSHKAFGG